jgi:hypothetical protein
MKQPRLMSCVESFVNIAVGLGVAMIANAVILPLVGFDVSLQQNAIIAGFMTVVSIVRSYGLRRLFEALHIRHPISPFMAAVIAERRRQIEVEGFAPEHDDEHRFGELARAGAAYLAHGNPGHPPPDFWPWEPEWWKPRDVRRNLVRGCALGIAEGERFDRLRKRKGKTAPRRAA